MQKRSLGQAATGASSLIGLILLLLIFYLVFLPPETRRELLAENVTRVPEAVAGQKGFFLQAYPGLLSFVEEGTIEHAIPNLQISETKNALVLGEANPFVVRRGWFVRDFERIPFTIEKPEDTFNVQLSFSASVRKGILTIKLNGRTVFEGRPVTSSVPPIQLKRELLQKENLLEFELSSPGLAFWKINEYEITGLKVIGDLVEWSRQQATNTFVLSAEEINSLKSSSLTFSPLCEQSAVGVLDVFVNEKSIYSSIPDCGSLNKIELAKEDFVEGRNTLIFRITKGSYIIEQIKIKNILKKPKSFINYFFINEANMSDIRAGTKKVWLNITFVDDRKLKLAVLNINGRLRQIDQQQQTYIKDITNDVIVGNNYIELMPQTELNIVSLEIWPE
ncbi:MAG: hypothetical protein QXU88_01920 [Candidatus Woesearchaeota archaeon]